MRGVLLLLFQEEDAEPTNKASSGRLRAGRFWSVVVVYGLLMGCLWVVYGFKMFAILFAMVSDGSQWCC